MQLPFVLVCFKTEASAFGDNALKISKTCESISLKHGVNLSVSPHVLDIRRVKENTNIPIFAQHFHPVDIGKHTGHIPAESLKMVGVNGAIINHAEKPLSLNGIRTRVNFAKRFDLTSIVCCKTPQEAEKIAMLKPDFISYEPPEYIGSTARSVSTARPEVLKQCIDAVSNACSSVKVLCGAGVRTADDVRIALDLGAVGFMVSTAVVKAKNPAAVLEDFCKAIKNHSSNKWHGS
ncbi:MAG: triose-phosphate isomerase [Candidatus Aenigmatarchaeota archaeon]